MRWGVGKDASDNFQPLIYNLGNGQGFSVRQVVEVARQVTGHPIPVIESPRREGDPAVLIASSEKIRRELGWQPKISGLENNCGKRMAMASRPSRRL